MSGSSTAKTWAVIKRLTGVEIASVRTFLLKQSLVPGKGFSAQYPGDSTVSCATTAICVYALSEMGLLTDREQIAFRNIILSFRLSAPADNAGAFPRTPFGTPSVWTTGQAALALASLRTPWKIVRPSVEWLLRTQGPGGGWNFPGTNTGYEKLIYTFYPALVISRFRRYLGNAGNSAMSRISNFIQSCDHCDDAWWMPMRSQLEHISRPAKKALRASDVVFLEYSDLFDQEESRTKRVDEDWMPERFNMAAVRAINYLHLRHVTPPDHPLSLLHIRALADDCKGSAWSDKPEDRPKTWTTALAALTLHLWARDLEHAGTSIRRLPTRTELLTKIRTGSQSNPVISPDARRLLGRLRQLRPGQAHANQYQHWVLDVITFLFGDKLKEAKPESKTFFGTVRRDITFRNAAETGPWFDWKSRHHIESVIVECKNTDELRYSDLRQTAVYLGRRMGYLGILACRKNTGADVLEFLNWLVNNDDKYVLIVNDQDLIDWIRLKDHGNDPTDAIADVYRSLREGAQ